MPKITTDSRDAGGRIRFRITGLQAPLGTVLNEEHIRQLNELAPGKLDQGGTFVFELNEPMTIFLELNQQLLTEWPASRFDLLDILVAVFGRQGPMEYETLTGCRFVAESDAREWLSYDSDTGRRYDGPHDHVGRPV